MPCTGNHCGQVAIEGIAGRLCGKPSRSGYVCCLAILVWFMPLEFGQSPFPPFSSQPLTSREQGFANGALSSYCIGERSLPSRNGKACN